MHGNVGGTWPPRAEQAPRNYYREYASADGAGGPYHNSGGFADFGDSDDVFSSFFSRRARGGHEFRAPGSDRHFSMEVDFLEQLEA